MQFSEQSNQALHRADLRALAEINNDQSNVFSLYLDLSSPQAALDRFEELLRQLAEQKRLDQAAAGYQEEWQHEADHIRRWLAQERLPQGQGLVIFSSRAADLWRVMRLTVPAADRLVVDTRPFVRPLEVLLAEFPCTLVALIDAGTARLIEVFLGRAQELDRLQTMPVTGGNVEDSARQHVQRVVGRIQAVWKEQLCDRLVIGGSSEILSALRADLPDEVRDQLAGEIHLTPQAEMAAILAQVQENEDKLERELEAQRVGALIADNERGGTAVMGLEQTMLAVRAKKVRLLLVEEGYRQEGGVCPNCGFLGIGEEGVCLLCEMALLPEPDIVEAALKRTLDTRGEIEVLRSQQSRGALEPYGRIGALLIAQSAQPTETDSANQRVVTSDGEIDPDSRRDETIDESFPASDPPGWA